MKQKNLFQQKTFLPEEIQEIFENESYLRSLMEEMPLLTSKEKEFVN